MRKPLNIKGRMVGERRFELPASWSRTKRATKLRYSPIFLFRLKCPILEITNRSLFYNETQPWSTTPGNLP
jgi:hypothetical protein